MSLKSLVFALCTLGSTGLAVAQGTPATAIDLGTLTFGNSPVNVTVPTYAAATVRWYKFTFSDNVLASAYTYLDIFTSNAGAGDLDTELGLYNPSGVKISDDDDDGDGYYSCLSWGIGGGGNAVGQDGNTLNAGTYYLVTGRYDTVFGATGFTVNSTGPANASPYNLTLRRGTNAPTPMQSITGWIDLNDTVGNFAINRFLGYTVRQGTTVVGSASILVNHSSTPFIVEVPATVLGAVTVQWDGASFLSNTVAANLNGTQSVVGQVVLSNGDPNNSGEVDAADIDLVIANFGQRFPGGSGNSLADVDCSGEVDAADIDIVIANFGRVNN